MRAQRQRVKHADAALVEQPVQQPLARKIGVDQFDILDGRDQRLAFDPGVVFRHRVGDAALRRIAWMQIGLSRPLRRLGEKLQQHSAGAPAVLRAFAAAPFLADRKPHSGRNLFRAQKIFMRGVLESAAFERHQPLIAAHVRPLVDGHGEMAFPQQRAGVLAFPEPPGIEARIGAQAVRRLKIHDQKRHRAVGLGLQNEAALEFQRRAEQGREHDRLAEQLADRCRIIVPGQDVIERGAEPGQAAAQIEGSDLERQHRVVDRNRRRRADRSFNGDFRVGGL